MAKRIAWVKPPEPAQACFFCGKPMSLTPISSMRYQEADGLKALKSRGFFYACICSQHELQPMRLEVLETITRA